MFIDKVKIKIASGRGGNGAMTFHREKFVAHGGPDGGDGGRGGSVWLEATTDMTTLLDFTYKSIFEATKGERGARNNCYGHSGKDITIKVPCGTIVRDPVADITIADLIVAGEKVLVAEGGRGGRGNAKFKSNKHRVPNYAEPGEPGVERELELELKMIADVGIIGFPNAGKSTLISRISAAKPKIADYAFTTVSPNLGVVKQPSGDAFVVADIPGLIEGASNGAGLGHEFLRHIERCRLLVHLIDVWGFMGTNVVTDPRLDSSNKIEAYGFEDPVENFKKINLELSKYSAKLYEKPQIVVLNKIEAYPEDELKLLVDRFNKLFSGELKEYGVVIKPLKLMSISAVTGEGVPALINSLAESLAVIPKDLIQTELDEDIVATNHDDSSFTIEKTYQKGGELVWMLSCGKLERMMKITDLRNLESLNHLFKVAKAIGVFEEMKRVGALPGELINIDGVEFELNELVLDAPDAVEIIESDI